MPDALAGVRVQTQQRVGEQVVAMPVRPVKIESRRAGRREDQSAPLIDNQPCPIVRAADVPPCVFRPRLVTEFARVRYRVKDPPLFSRANVERADVARREQLGRAGCRSTAPGVVLLIVISLGSRPTKPSR